MGAPIPTAEATAALTVTPELAALMLQTQTAKFAVEPGTTCEFGANGWTCTHSSGVLAAGVGLDEPGVGELFVGLGFGLGECVEGLGDGLELADDLVLLGVGDGSLVLGSGLGLELCPEVGLELAVLVSVGVALALDLAVEVELALAWVLVLGCVLAVRLGVVLPVGDADEARAAATCAVRFAPFGITAQAALVIGPTGCTGPPSSAARACPNMLDEMNAKPVRAPTTAGLTTSCALTPDLTSCSLAPDFPASIMPTLCVVCLDAPS